MFWISYICEATLKNCTIILTLSAKHRMIDLWYIIPMNIVNLLKIHSRIASTIQRAVETKMSQKQTCTVHVLTMTITCNILSCL